MFGKKIKIDDGLYDKLKIVSEKLGVPMDEYCNKVLAAEADKILLKNTKKEVSKEEEDAIAAQMKGLGYLE